MTLQSNDVIHSFWMPNLAGKQDLIPGRVTDMQLLPRKIGLFRGQCAEFCGVQHAHMALDVTVESKRRFPQMVGGAAARPARARKIRSSWPAIAYVTTRDCAACHTIAGTPGERAVAPDLTHFASRREHRRGDAADERGQSSRRGSPTRKSRSPATTCPRSA